TSAPPQLPAPARSCGQSLSVSNASVSRAVASLPDGPRRRCGLRSSRRARKTSSPSRSPAYREDAISCAPLAPRWSCSCGSRPHCRSPLCAFRLLAFPPLLLLPGRGAFARDGLHPGNVLAQGAQLLQALSLSHIQLELELEELVVHFLFLMTKFFVRKIDRKSTRLNSSH